MFCDRADTDRCRREGLCPRGEAAGAGAKLFRYLGVVLHIEKRVEEAVRPLCHSLLLMLAVLLLDLVLLAVLAVLAGPHMWLLPMYLASLETFSITLHPCCTKQVLTGYFTLTS